MTDSLFIGTVIAESDLTNAILRRVLLMGANLSQSIFTNADLTDADLSRAELQEAVMENVNLTGTTLRKTSGVDVEYWLQNGCIFCRTTMPNGSVRNDNC
ncbi:MAG: pentapeptide repeat-containing protein [Aphanocapsa sp. GSE-SYN-MK-11-07L]|nr:pentapeptide repeat-containing protein [Aphanocapsa sp. GSE-SYN-MK-11-07L]